MVDEENAPYMIMKCADCSFEDEGYKTEIIEQEAKEHAEVFRHKVDISVQRFFSYNCRGRRKWERQKPIDETNYDE